MARRDRGADGDAAAGQLARESGKRIHVLHISTKQEIDYLRDHKDVASCEATPHHLTLVAPECYERLGTRAQMNPPVRSADHREGIWYGIEQGIIDVLGSDHAPHTLEEKAKTYPASPSGMTGVQTLVPIMLDHVNAGRLSLARFVDLTSAGPARLYNIACKGRIAAGYDADFTVVDLKRSETITNKWVASSAGWTPYDGVRVTGWPVGTFVRGKRVMWQGELVTPSTGEPVRFLETLKAWDGTVMAERSEPIFARKAVMGSLRSRPRSSAAAMTERVYCFASDIENSPLRTRAGRPSTNFATASSP